MRSLPTVITSAKRSGGASFLHYLALMLLLGAFSQQVQAADGATGTVEGRVLNLSNGRYLGKAVVKVEGTDIETLTNDFGEYVLRNVPVGAVKITASFTAQEPKTVDLTVEADKTAEKDIGLSQAKEIGEDGVLVLDPYVVAQQRYKSGQEIAINEERQSVNIKNVVTTDSLGHIPDGNIGEFVRFMPGIDVTYGGSYVNGADAYSVSVRGFGPENTAIMVDGMALSSPSPGSLSRTVTLDMISINNASRIEVTKVATPDMPSDSPGGSINLITRSAFEYARPDITTELNFTFNTMELPTIHKKPGPANEKTYHTIPGGRVSVVYPLTKNLGMSVSVASDNKYQPNQKSAANWLTTASTSTIVNNYGTVNIANPFMRRFDITDSPWSTSKNSGNIRLDWRAFPGLTINTNFQYSRYTGITASRRMQFSVERPGDWDGTFVSGKPLQTDGSSKAAMTAESRDKAGDTTSMYIKAAYTNGPWSIDANISRSLARGHYDDMVNGHFSGYDLAISNVGQVVLSGVQNATPSSVKVYNRTGQEIDYTKIDSWTVSNASTLDCSTGEAFQRDATDVAALNLRRELDFLPWKMGFKVGVYHQSKYQKKWGRGTGWKTRYVGADRYGYNLTGSNLIDDTYQVSPGFGQPVQQWADTYKLYSLYLAHPEYFDENISIANQTSSYNSLVSQRKAVREVADSMYAMLDGQFLNNRLKVSGGARRKYGKISGYQPYTDSNYLYLKNKDGTVYKDSVYTKGIYINGSSVTYITTGTATATATYSVIWNDTALASRLAAAGVSLPSTAYFARSSTDSSISTYDTTATAAGTYSNNLDLAKMRLQTRNINAKRWEPVTPMLGASYSITKDFDVKLSWSRETKLADLEAGTSSSGYMSSASASTDTSTGVTTITINNSGLSPEITNSFNLELAYYSPKGGSFSISGFYKRINNQWETTKMDATTGEGAALASSVGYDPTTLQSGDIVSTTVNGSKHGTSRGIELEARQNLGIIANWLQNFDAFATYTYRLHSSFSYDSKIVNQMTGKSQDKYSAGLSYSNKRLTLQTRATYATDYYDLNGTRTYNGQTIEVYNYYRPEYRVNFEASYRISERYSVFASVSDAIRSTIESQVRDFGTGYIPKYAWTVSRNKYGANVTVGVSGKF